MSEHQWMQVVAKLINQTKAAERKWEPVRLERENIVGQAYRTDADGRTVTVYEYRYQSYNSDLDSIYWANEVAIEFIDDNGELLWSFPQVPNRWDLIEAVRYRVVDADGFLNDFLKE